MIQLNRLDGDTMEVINNMLVAIGNSYMAQKHIYDAIGTVLGILTVYKTVYFVIGLLFTRKFKPAKKKHKYGIVIAARNEEKVIGNLLDSIKKQDYPKELLTVFVVADNCTDNTAVVAKKMGAIVYSRCDSEHRTKGYALEFLFDNIEKDYGIKSYEGFFLFDADNLLKSDFISKMNDAFDSGEKIITSYRNSKNFSENWVASTYAIHWLRSIRTYHRARSVLRLATNIQGTGFLFASEIVNNGWHYTSLTEDRALTADAVAQGYQISYQDEAMFYDEQPTSLAVALRQRLRWSKGHLQAFVQTGPYLFLNIFLGKHYVKTKWRDNKGRVSIWESIRHRFASFDTLMQLTPISFINLCRWVLVCVFAFAAYHYVNGIDSYHLFSGGNYLVKFLRSINDITVSFSSGMTSFMAAIYLAIVARVLYRVSAYFVNMWMALYIFLVEDRRIVKISIWKKILYIFTWPIFDIIGRYTTYIAIFKKVEWKPIPHDSKIKIEDVEGK